MRYILSLSLFALFLLLSCSDSKKTTGEKMKNDASLNFSIVVEIINNRMPSISPSENTNYCIVNLTPKKEVLENDWKIHKFVLNDVSYFTFDDNKLKGKGESQYQNVVREIQIEKNNKISIIFINDQEEKIDFTIEDVPVSVVH